MLVKKITYFEWLRKKSNFQKKSNKFCRLLEDIQKYLNIKYLEKIFKIRFFMAKKRRRRPPSVTEIKLLILKLNNTTIMTIDTSIPIDFHLLNPMEPSIWPLKVTLTFKKGHRFHLKVILRSFWCFLSFSGLL